MGFFGWFKPRQIQITDPDLGVMQYNKQKSRWHGRLQTLLSDSLLDIFIEGDEHGPYPDFKALYFLLLQRYEELRPAILLELYKHWENIKQHNYLRDYDHIDNLGDLHEILHLAAISVESMGFELQFEFKGDIWPDAGLFIDIVDWKPIQGPLID